MSDACSRGVGRAVVAGAPRHEAAWRRRALAPKWCRRLEYRAQGCERSSATGQLAQLPSRGALHDGVLREGDRLEVVDCHVLQAEYLVVFDTLGDGLDDQLQGVSAALRAPKG